MTSFSFEMGITRYKIFGMAKDLITWIFPSNASPLQLQPFNNPQRYFLIDSKLSLQNSAKEASRTWTRIWLNKMANIWFVVIAEFFFWQGGEEAFFRGTEKNYTPRVHFESHSPDWRILWKHYLIRCQSLRSALNFVSQQTLIRLFAVVDNSRKWFSQTRACVFRAVMKSQIFTYLKRRTFSLITTLISVFRSHTAWVKI